ncbi:MAG: phosphoenolpyruvate carboxylase [Planctomycetes bacterium]|nr:phosphoenolpyruvate carboxylase [Planctomycetota bacterium]
MTPSPTDPTPPRHAPAEELGHDVRLLGDLLGETLAEQRGPAALALIEDVRQAAIALRQGALPRGREAFAEKVAGLDLDALEQVSRTFTRYFHLINAAEEQHRVRALRRRDRPDAAPPGSIRATCADLARAGTSADDVRALLGRLFVMPVLTAHPTEARRRTVLDHLEQVGLALERLDDARHGWRERRRTLEALREVVLTLHVTEDALLERPTPLDEVRAGLDVFERTLLAVTPAIYRELEDGLRAAFPGEPFDVGPVLRWGTWIGGDRDGNPNVTAEVTAVALARQRAVALASHEADVEALARALSVSARRLPPGDALAALEASLARDRERLPEVAARARREAALEPLREKLRYARARLQATRARAEGGYPDAAAYEEDLRLVERALVGSGLGRLAAGRLKDAIRRAEVFGFHLASLDVREHSAVHEAATDELLARGGAPGYARLGEEARVTFLAGLLERAYLPRERDRAGLSPRTRELLATLDAVGRGRREAGAPACERYVVSFTSAPSDLLEVLFLARTAGLAPDELRPVPLLEQLEDLAQAGPFARRLLELPAVRVALRGELEVMIGYSDSGKQVGYVASAVALRDAQRALARVAQDEPDLLLTVFHGRGGAIGRGGGPASRAIAAQPPEALRGRLRVTEQGETIAARYARPEIARRDLEQMLGAVLLASRRTGEGDDPAREATLQRAARAAHDAYAGLLADRERLARYAVAATPLQEVAQLPIASRPASRAKGLVFEELRAIPWVFSWNQSRHGLPGWFGLGAALEAIAAAEGPERARALYREWPFFRALVDNAQLALARADIDVAARYARLAGDDGRPVFDAIAAEHARTVAAILQVTGAATLLADQPTIARTVALRNPYVDALSHAQVELLGRLRAAGDDAARARLREVLFTTINGIAAGLQTAG